MVPSQVAAWMTHDSVAGLAAALEDAIDFLGGVERLPMMQLEALMRAGATGWLGDDTVRRVQQAWQAESDDHDRAGEVAAAELSDFYGEDLIRDDWFVEGSSRD